MTVKEIATLWGCSESKVRNYCKKGYILGAHKANNLWVIPDNYLEPFISRKQKFRSRNEKFNYVLNAINSEKNLDFNLMSLNENEFYALADLLASEGYVINNDGVFCTTLKGASRCAELKQTKRDKTIKTVIDATTCVTSILSAVPNCLTILGS